MKKALLLSALFISCIALNATTHTVSNASHLPAQFATLQAAVDAAADGDTLLIQNTGIPYASVTLNKELHFFGSSSIPGQSARIETLLLDGAVCNGSSFTSIQIHNVNSTSAAPQAYSDLTFRRCHIGYMGLATGTGVNYANWLIEGCVFYVGATNSFYVNVNYSTANFFVFRNNICFGYVLGLYDAQISNNIFAATNNTNPGLQEVASSVISNNIFYGSTASVTGPNLELYNNISFGGSSTTFPIGSGNIGQNNIENVDPMFQNFPLNAPYSSDLNFALQAGSPAIGAGVDGQDLGLYDGTGIYRADTEPDIPVVRSVVIPGGNIVPAQSTFQITVNSVSHQ